MNTSSWWIIYLAICCPNLMLDVRGDCSEDKIARAGGDQAIVALWASLVKLAKQRE